MLKHCLCSGLCCLDAATGVCRSLKQQLVCVDRVHSCSMSFGSSSMHDVGLAFSGMPEATIRIRWHILQNQHTSLLSKDWLLVNGLHDHDLQFACKYKPSRCHQKLKCCTNQAQPSTPCLLYARIYKCPKTYRQILSQAVLCCASLSFCCKPVS